MHEHAHAVPRTVRGRLRLPLWLGFLGFLTIASFTWTEHRAHLLSALPFLLLLACPLMHFFMHGEHGHAAEHHDAVDSRPGGRS